MMSRSSSVMSSANVGRGAVSLKTNVVMSQGFQTPAADPSRPPGRWIKAVAGAGPSWDGGVMFSHRQRVARMRRVAVRALDAYPLVDRELRFISDDENTTFRVDATAPDGRDRFLLRVHRPARHGRNIDSAPAIGSELAWLTALRAGTDLLVPVPLPTTDGKLTTVAASPDVPEPRVCSVLRSMDGR